jgi:phosphatidylserine/phosphatidylglycerophosphate/cardiolipin synthase-like enzyme
MDGARVRLARMVGAADRLDRFRVYVPVTDGGNDIYVHAKVSIVDDRLLRVGSANMNNRSLGLDSECDLAIDCALPANHNCGPAITALRERLMAEHLGRDAADVAEVFAETGSLIATIDRLTRPGRCLELLDLEKPGPLDAFIADNQLLDPERPESMFEPLSRRSIWSGWRGGREMLRRRMGRRAAR